MNIIPSKGKGVGRYLKYFLRKQKCLLFLFIIITFNNTHTVVVSKILCDTSTVKYTNKVQ